MIKMTARGTKAAIASAEGSHGPLNNTNTTSQSSANGSSMSTDHSLLVGVSQTPVQSSGGLSSNSTPPPSHSNSTQQLHAASARRSVNTQYQLDADSYDYYVCLTQPIGHGKHGTDNCGQQYRT